MIRRRHVIYVSGYDPQGAEGYHGLFARSFRRFAEIWGVQARLGPLVCETQDLAHWDIETAGPNWRAATRYDFLRQEHFIRANMAQPLTRQVLRALRWSFDYLLGGTLFRVFRASWEFGLVLLYFQALLNSWLALAVLGGYLAAVAAALAGLPGLAASGIGLLAVPAVFLALRPLADLLFVVQINSHWPYLCELARGEPTCFDAAIEAGAQRLIAAARDTELDEVVVVGHSGGGVIAPAIVVRALELDPEVGRRGPPLVLLTLGSIAPGVALHRRATRLRAVFARLAVEPSLTWIDAQSRKDVLNFWHFDPVEGIGISAGAHRRNPLLWRVRFRDMLSEDLYHRIRINFFRMHYQFIMANDRRAPYDYFMLVAGPLPVTAWAAEPRQALEAFADDASLAVERVPATAAR